MFLGEGVATSSLKDPEKTLAKPKNWTWEISVPFSIAKRCPCKSRQLASSGTQEILGSKTFCKCTSGGCAFCQGTQITIWTKSWAMRLSETLACPMPPSCGLWTWWYIAGFWDLPNSFRGAQIEPKLRIDPKPSAKISDGNLPRQSDLAPNGTRAALMCADFYVPLSDSRACTHFMHLRSACA